MRSAAPLPAINNHAATAENDLLIWVITCGKPEIISRDVKLSSNQALIPDPKSRARTKFKGIVCRRIVPVKFLHFALRATTARAQDLRTTGDRKATLAPPIRPGGHADLRALMRRCRSALLSSSFDLIGGVGGVDGAVA